MLRGRGRIRRMTSRQPRSMCAALSPASSLPVQLPRPSSVRAIRALLSFVPVASGFALRFVP